MFEKAQQLIDSRVCKKVFLDSLANEFEISHREVHKRIRSMFGKSVEDLLKPSKEEMTRMILQADSIDDLKMQVGNPYGLGALYEEFYGVSTFASARKVCEQYREITPYSPTKDDNLSILISQKLGDGYVERGNSFHIQHGERQFNYLVEKVKLFNKAFPTTNPVGSIKKYRHTQGHFFYSWRSGVIRNAQMQYVAETDDHLLIRDLTPLGMFLLYMDDGCLKQSCGTVITICVPCEKTRIAVVAFLKSYKIASSSYDNDKAVVMTNVVDVSCFLNTFVRPFEKFVPADMLYKARLMI